MSLRLAIKAVLRSIALKTFNGLLNWGMKELHADDLKKSAVVFAPHPDDETLACGGTLIEKKRAGAAIKVVFVTNGAYSHVQLMAADQLKTIRRREAISACKCLGVDETDIIFLDFEDGKFIDTYENAVDHLAKILSEVQPEEVFVPYRGDQDPNRDHIGAHQAVMEAIRSLDMKVTINEYPVWLWYRWPWMNLPLRKNRSFLKVFMENVDMARRLFSDFNHFLFVGHILERKKTALNRHQSQIKRLIPDQRWMTLGDLAGGQFLELFFQDREIYYRHKHV
jgi:LmbE family N-acetylglucosaminyl deacetylase